MPKIALFALACLGLLALPGQGWAACARFTASNVNVTYDPLGSEGVTQIVQPLPLTVARGSDAGTTGVQAQFVDHDSVTSLRIGTLGPIYTIQGSQTVVVDRIAVPLDGAHSFVHDFEGTGTGLDEPIRGLQLIIDPGQDIPAGVYSEGVDIQYRCLSSDPTAATSLQSAVLRISVSVPSKLTASLAGGSSSGTLDFGDFSTLSRTGIVNIYSTGPFSLQIASSNGGAMKLQGSPMQGSNASLSYSVNFAGVPIAFGDTPRFERTGNGGAGLPLQVTAEQPDAKRAGTYHDSLTLTFTPLATL